MRIVKTTILILLSWAIHAQNDNETVSVTIPELSLLSLQPNNSSIVLSVSVVGEAGDIDISSSTDNSKYLNYTVSLASSSSSQGIYAEISSGSLATGVSLSIEASNYMGSGQGQLGNSMGEVLLSTGSQKIITGIRGSHTGVGTGNGHQLTYSLEVSNPENVGQISSGPLTITYTLTDD